MKLNTTEELLQDIYDGKMIILMDDEERENEGDLVMASSRVRPQDINFMASYGRGLICLTLTMDHCRRLNLPLMTMHEHDVHKTNFTISIEAAEGVTTGISASDRALTIQKAVAENAQPSDLIQPGHVFPLMAMQGGVLIRAGHTEAGCDIARLAGLTPSATIVEILNDDGTMARRKDLESFAKKHQLKIGTIADLIRFRVENEKTIEHMTKCTLPTDYGKFTLHAYQDKINRHVHLALVKGTISPDTPMLVRVHLENPISDLTGSNAPDRGWPISDVLKCIEKEGTGILVILCHQYDTMQIINQIESYKSTTPTQPEHSDDLRTIGLGAQILADLGVRKMRLMSSPKRIHALSGFNLEIVEYIH